MASVVQLDFPGDRIALVVRNKHSHTHHPDLGDQHADCILANGAPVGFFGDMTGRTVPMGVKGYVATYPIFRSTRPHYVDMGSARGAKCISALLVVSASATEVREFMTTWNHMRASPDEFSIASNNCASHASRAFMDAGLLPDGIPGTDTPDNLYDQLVRALGARCTVEFGYVGFMPRAGSGTDPLLSKFDVMIEPVAGLAPPAGGGSLY
jgi:hypothetical protein